MKVTVIMPCYARLDRLDMFIRRGWLEQPEVNEVIVFDNSGKFSTELSDVLVISANRNLGPQAKLVAAQFAQNDVILFADDDVLARPHLVEDLLQYYTADGMVGIMGKVFTGDTYYTATGYRGKNISSPVKVDYLCGLVMMMSREHTFVDVRDCPSRYLDDWWLQHELGLANQVHEEGESKMVVVPTDKYEVMEENEDENALHLMPELKEMREKYFKKWIRGVDI